MSSEDYVVLVTGASRGLGRAIAVDAAKRSHVKVAVAYNSSKEAAEQTLAALSGTGHAIFQANVTKSIECERLMKEVIERYGRLDALVNNAGIAVDTSVKTMTFDEFNAAGREAMDVNATSASNLTFLALQVMRKQEQRGLDQCCGRIVMLSSRSALNVEPIICQYGASKAADSMLGQTLARTMGPDSIGFYAIAPTVVASDMTARWLEDPDINKLIVSEHPHGRIPSPEEVGRTGAWLAIEAPLAISGSVIDICGACHVHH